MLAKRQRANQANSYSEVKLSEPAKKCKPKQSEQACAQAKHVESSQELRIVKPKHSKASNQANNLLSKLGGQVFWVSRASKEASQPINQAINIQTNQPTN